MQQQQKQQNENIELPTPLALKSSYDRLDLEVDSLDTEVLSVLSEAGLEAENAGQAPAAGTNPAAVADKPKKSSSRRSRRRSRRKGKKKKKKKKRSSGSGGITF